MNTHDNARRFYAQLVTAKAAVTDPRLIDAFAQIKREQFVGPGPWHIKIGDGYVTTETDDPVVLYQDILVALAPERGINNGEPSLHARCIAAANPKAGDSVAHIGAGAGYYTAILAHLVGEDGCVHAYEIETDIARRAIRNLSNYSTVTVHPESALDSPLPLADVIYVNAGATHVPAPWLDALKPGGRLVLPLVPNEGLGCMLLVTRRSNTAYAALIFSTAGFIPCIGARDEVQSRALAAALETGNPDEVRSLRRGSESDETAWCVGDGWWLSVAEP